MGEQGPIKAKVVTGAQREMRVLINEAEGKIVTIQSKLLEEWGIELMYNEVLVAQIHGLNQPGRLDALRAVLKDLEEIEEIADYVNMEYLRGDTMDLNPVKVEETDKTNHIEEKIKTLEECGYIIKINEKNPWPRKNKNSVIAEFYEEFSKEPKAEEGLIRHFKRKIERIRSRLYVKKGIKFKAKKLPMEPEEIKILDQKTSEKEVLSVDEIIKIIADLRVLEQIVKSDENEEKDNGNGNEDFKNKLYADYGYTLEASGIIKYKLKEIIEKFYNKLGGVGGHASLHEILDDEKEVITKHN